YSGPTKHYVEEHYDTGRILAQRVVPVLANDTAFYFCGGRGVIKSSFAEMQYSTVLRSNSHRHPFLGFI
ncbi:---NA---, partial [Olea europaea subsp. europaea]